MKTAKEYAEGFYQKEYTRNNWSSCKFGWSAEYLEKVVKLEDFLEKVIREVRKETRLEIIQEERLYSLEIYGH